MRGVLMLNCWPFLNGYFLKFLFVALYKSLFLNQNIGIQLYLPAWIQESFMLQYFITTATDCKLILTLVKGTIHFLGTWSDVRNDIPLIIFPIFLTTSWLCYVNKGTYFCSIIYEKGYCGLILFMQICHQAIIISKSSSWIKQLFHYTFVELLKWRVYGNLVTDRSIYVYI